MSFSECHLSTKIRTSIDAAAAVYFGLQKSPRQGPGDHDSLRQPATLLEVFVIDALHFSALCIKVQLAQGHCA
ncbi:hypothetical protein ACN47E_000028 [Coniothyrium glycines]